MVHADEVTVRLTAFLRIPQKVTVTTDFCHGHRVTSSLAAWSHSHGVFSDGHMVLIQSWAVFRRSQAVTPATGLSTAHIGVATP